MPQFSESPPFLDLSGQGFLRQEPEAGNLGKGVCRSGYIAVGGVSRLHSPPPQGSNGTFLLSLTGPDEAAFSVSPGKASGSTDVQVLVRSPALVDYEEKTVMVVQVRGARGPRSVGYGALWSQGHCPLPCPQVVATDSISGDLSVASVTIHLRDINDHRPTFAHSQYNLSVFEHSAVGTVVASDIHVSYGRGWARLGSAGRG